MAGKRAREYHRHLSIAKVCICPFASAMNKSDAFGDVVHERHVHSKPQRYAQIIVRACVQTGSTMRAKDIYDEVHAINDICFHPVGTFVTAGSDGCFITWDKDQKSRLQKPSQPAQLPLTAASFNSAGTLLAYATGYDWGQGHAYYDPANPAYKPQIMLHKLTPGEIGPRGK